MKNIHVLPNVITAFGLTCGLFIIFRISMVSSFYEEPTMPFLMVIILLIAGIADVLDGAVARAVKAESEFGGFFDSLSDAVTFGVAPPVIVLKTFHLPMLSEWSFFLNAGAMIFSICALLRLVRFSVIDSRVKSNAEEGFRSDFKGLPVPAAAISVTSLNLVLFSHGEKWVNIGSWESSIVMSICFMLIGYLMVSRIRFLSIKSLEFKRPSFPLVFFIVLFACSIFYGFIHFFEWFLVILSWGYICLSLLLSLLIKKQKEE